MVGAKSLWAGRDLYHATPIVTLSLGFLFSLSQMTTHTVAAYDTQSDVKTRIITGVHSVSSCYTQGYWLIDYLLFYVSLKTFSLEGLQNLGLCSALGDFSWAGRDLYCSTPTVTRDLGFSGPPLQSALTTGMTRMWRIYSNLRMRHTKECGEPIK